MPAQQHRDCDSFRYRRAAFYNGLKSKLGLATAKAAALRVTQHQRLQHRSSPGSFVTVFCALASPTLSALTVCHATRTLERGGPTRTLRPRLVASHSTRPLTHFSSFLVIFLPSSSLSFSLSHPLCLFLLRLSLSIKPFLLLLPRFTALAHETFLLLLLRLRVSRLARPVCRDPGSKPLF